MNIRTITYQLELGLSRNEIGHQLDKFNNLVNDFSDMHSRPRTHRVVRNGRG